MWLTKMRRERAAKIGRIVLPYIPPQGSRVLDIGCGRGHIAAYLGKEGGAKIVGTDIADKLETTIPFFLYDGRKLPFKDKEFGLGLLIFVLHHTEDELHLLSEAQRVSERILVMEDVYSNIFSYLFTVLMDFILNYGKGSLKFKKAEEWEKIFSERNLRILEKKKFRLGMFGPSSHYLFLLQSSSN